MRWLAVTLAITVSAMAADVVVSDVLAQEHIDEWQVQDLRRAVSEGTVEARTQVVADIAASGRKEALPAVYRALESYEPAVTVAAISAMGAMWPTTPQDVETVRALVSSSNNDVAQAAAAFLGTVGDDAGVEPLIQRLAWKADDAVINQALTEITGQQFASISEWQTWNESRIERQLQFTTDIDGMLAQSSSTEVMAAVSMLVAAPDRNRAMIERLIVLADHEDPSIAQLARAGLTTSPGPLAACWRADHQIAEPGAPIDGAAVETTDASNVMVVTLAGKPRVPQAAYAAPAAQAAANQAAQSEAGTSNAVWAFVVVTMLGSVGWWFTRRGRPVAKTAVADVPAKDERKKRLSVTFVD